MPTGVIDLRIGPITPIILRPTIQPIKLTAAPSRIVLRVAPQPIKLKVTPQPIRLRITGVGAQGPRGPAGTGSAQFDTVNKQGSSIATGAPMATYTTGVGAVLANATTTAKPCIGLNMSAAADQAAITIQTAGPFELADWTAITGTVELVAKAVYFLDLVDGKLTTTCPASTGNAVQRVGKAVSPTILDIDQCGFIKL